jgi:MFS family permease
VKNLRLARDGRLLFATRAFRLFAYGFLSVVLMIYLAEVGLSETQIGILFTLTLIGDTIISFWVSTAADRLGRRRMLVFGSLLMTVAGVFFATTDNFVLLLIAATIGIISPSGYEVGPFLPIEQAALAHVVPDERRTHVFSWYTLLGSFATALGALFGGGLTQALRGLGMAPLGGYRVIVISYAAAGLILCFLFSRLSHAVEVARPSPSQGTAQRLTRILGLHQSRRVVLKLSALFSLDAFAGGFVLQSMMAYWFHVRFHVQPAFLGGIFFGANVLAGVSALTAAWIASRIGLVRTMVFTHIPSNILLILVPLMPNLPLAIAMLLLRFSISQMDVPTRQSYTMAIVSPDERAAAAGITGMARTTGASLSPMITGRLLAQTPLLNVPFFLAGGIKIIYDLMLYRSFRALRPPEEKSGAGVSVGSGRRR